MRRLAKAIWYSLSIFSVVFLISSCSKDAVAPDTVDESYTVSFNFKDFESSSTPLHKNARALARRATTKWAATDPSQSQSIQQGYLYYWSFNNETLYPDIRVTDEAIITYTSSEEEDDFRTGWKYDTYDAGQALSMKGLEEWIVEIPLTQVIELDRVGFDISSSGTGPKAFDLSYSQDGEQYKPIATDNQFSNTNTQQAKNTFEFDLTNLPIDLEQKLYMKIIPLAGERGNAGEYNPVTGVTRIDNFRLTGVAEVLNEATVFKVHYHIFDAVSRNMVIAGAEVFEPGSLPELSFSLPVGDYYASFVTNISNAELPVPEHATADEYFITNIFSNHRARVFGLVDSFAVDDSDLQLDLTLQRYYSQIRFEFTDTEDLSNVGKLIFTPEHDPYFYAPFLATMTNPVLDQSDIVLIPDFEADGKEVVFHQFMGIVPSAQPLQYRVEVYDKEGELLRTFTVSSMIKQNLQLVFRGQLLPQAEQDVKFTVKHNEVWDGQQEEGF